MYKKLIYILLLINIIYSSQAREKKEFCKFTNTDGIPCIYVSKTPNTSEINKNVVNKIVITKDDISKINANDVGDVLSKIAGIDVFQSGQKGQQTSVFMRGSESNHTLVLLNGIPINDQSTTDGLHDFGQDFVQTIQQIEIYKGSNGAHFGPSAIAGAINFITTIDYSNKISVSGYNLKNNSTNINVAQISDNDWHLNFKAGFNQSETGSAIAGGTERDGMLNHQYGLNSEKWLNDNIKMISTLYSRQTKSDYDGSSTNENGFVSDNKMYALQSGFDYKTLNYDGQFKVHYHNYDREYENEGYLDEYYSESFVLKGEHSTNSNNNFSYGLGSEFKYDWGNFENRGSYNASTKGHMKNLGLYGNVGIKNNKKQLLSFYGRMDNHNTTGNNFTYKITLSQNLNKHFFGTTHTTGFRNPSLYELYGSDNYGIVGNVNLNPEKSQSNEIFIKTQLSKHVNFNTFFYRSKIFDRIETNGAYTTFENFSSSINQEGVETNLVYNRDDIFLSFYANSSKSRKSGGTHQSRRPDFSYGLNFIKDLYLFNIDNLVLSIDYKYTDKYLDWDGSKNSFQKSTDLMNVLLKKKWDNRSLVLNIKNFLNERYEKPATYKQDGRQLSVKYVISY